MPSPAVQTALAELTSFMKPGVSIADQRAAYDRCFARLPIPEETAIETTSVGGVPAEVITTPASGETVILYLHGGGYMLGSPASYRGLGSRLATAGGVQRVSG